MEETQETFTMLPMTYSHNEEEEEDLEAPPESPPRRSDLFGVAMMVFGFLSVLALAILLVELVKATYKEELEIGSSGNGTDGAVNEN